MNNFTYQNSVKIEFGKGSIAKLGSLISKDKTVGLFFGGGSIKKNGVYAQVVAALGGRKIYEFGGIEPNPEFETCLKAIEFIKEKKIDFLLAVGGGSVLDAVKYMSGAVFCEDGDFWKIVTDNLQPAQALPIGCVLTLPATGSEMNANSVISRRETKDKMAISSPLYRPAFSILDPETTYSLSWRQTANGIADAFVHVMEQYMCDPVNSPLQDRQAEAILLTLLEQADLIKEDENNYDVRANIMWCATQALNGIISCGVKQDWATHRIGHELTALYGIDHARSLAVVLPGLLSFRRSLKREKLLQMGERLWGVEQGDPNVRMDETIGRIILFFETLGVHTRLRDYDIDGKEAAHLISEKMKREDQKWGEDGGLDSKGVSTILLNRA